MSILREELDRAFGAGQWQKTSAGIMVGGQLRVPNARIKIWLHQQLHPPVMAPPMPIVRPRPVVIPPPMNPAVFAPQEKEQAADTPMPFLKKPPVQQKAQASKPKRPKKADALRCKKCNDIWEECNCGLIWCPYCGYEPPSGTQRGLDMHVKAKHPEIDWK